MFPWRLSCVFQGFSRRQPLPFGPLENVVSNYLSVPQGGHPNAFHPAFFDRAVPLWDHGIGPGCTLSATRRIGSSAKSIRILARPWTVGIESRNGRYGLVSPT